VPDLCRVFPVLQRVPALVEAAAGRAPAADADEVRQRAFSALRELFARLADTRPLVVAIDDLQWGDADSGRFLVSLIAPPDPPRMLLVGAYRSDEAERSALIALVRDFRRRDGRAQIDTIALEPLPESSAIDLATQLIQGREEADRARLAAAIAAEAGGSPFFIGELARANVSANASSSLGDVIAERVAALAPDARSLLETVAVAAGPVPRDAALRAAGLASSNDAAIPVLRTASLLRTTDERIETYHDRIRETVVARLAQERRREIHAALADALASIPSPPVEALALHAREAGRAEDALRYTVQAAERAAAAVAFDRAASFYRDALDLAPEGASQTRRDLERRLADALADAGKGREAADLYLRAAAGAPPDEVIELERRAAIALISCGEVERGVDTTRAVMRRVGLWLPVSRLLALLLGSIMLLYVYARAARFASRAARRSDADRRRRVEVSQSLVVPLLMTEHVYGGYVTGRSAFGAMATDDVLLLTTALVNVCITAGMVRPTDARLASRFALVHRLAAARSHPKLEPLEAFATAGFAYMTGRWADALSGFERAEDGYGKCSDACAELNTVRAFNTWTLFYLGEIRVLSERAPRLAVEARARGDLLALNRHVAAFGTPAWLAKDDVGTVSRELQEAFGQWPGKTFQMPHNWYMMARGLIHLYEGEGQKLHALYEARWPALARSGMLATKIIAQQLVWLRAAAAVAAAVATQDANRARALLSAAERHARKLAKNPVLGSVPMADLVLGAVAHARGDVKGAMRSLESAVDAFDALDMRAFAAAARRRLGKLRGGDEGAALVKMADDFMTAQGIVKPERFARMLTAGYPDDR
jgi:hypothetical protein